MLIISFPLSPFVISPIDLRLGWKKMTRYPNFSGGWPLLNQRQVVNVQ